MSGEVGVQAFSKTPKNAEDVEEIGLRQAFMGRGALGKSEKFSNPLSKTIENGFF